MMAFQSLRKIFQGKIHPDPPRETLYTKTKNWVAFQDQTCPHHFQKAIVALATLQYHTGKVQFCFYLLNADANSLLFSVVESSVSFPWNKMKTLPLKH